MSDDSVVERHKAAGPTRMLALDGGGIRGILSLGYLKRIESILRIRYGDEEYVLSRYFDLVGGTSTGAIIAALLSTGRSVDDVTRLYLKLADRIFKKRFWRNGLIFAKFGERALNEVLKKELGDMIFNDPRILTGLMIMTKRWDTRSTWVLHNVRGSQYYRKYTHGYLVRQVVRASTAAPSFFRPERFEVKPGTHGAFVDGGVTPHNNPAWQMLMLATMRGYGLSWPLGADRLFIVSVGTGRREATDNPMSWKNRLPAVNAVTSLTMMMDDASELNETLLQWLSESPTAREINKEIGALDGEWLGGTPCISYVRYNAYFNPSWLQTIGIMLTDKEAQALSKMDDARNVELLQKIGVKAGENQVREDHFPTAFDQ